ncbi:ABC transporter permease YtrF precursor [Aquisphaera giovannonii]|uniref:ABC transporter permease YtrF n=1 Tax=Aquisphaera giovannonii TaxID=406548 RepID=A0A5B9W850_9BACT|nr:ABC transporter permease [Aquisphaera giovannonii]QEH36181.1 ABC transporter permease YtrF precursor [Aquisphaera giovannonii]
MRWIDLLRFPLASLGQQKMRTCLTTLGVVFGAFVLAASLSIDEGVQRTIERESSRGDVARKVTVSSGWKEAEAKPADDAKVSGRMSPDRRERIRKVLAQRPRQGGAAAELIGLTPGRLDSLSRLPHVERVIPVVGEGGVATLGNRPEGASVSSGAGEAPEFRKRLIAGRAFESDDERSVLLSEMFAYRIGLVDDADLDQVLGRPLRIELRGREDGPSFYVSLADRSKSGGGREEQSALRQLAWQIPGVLDRFSLTGEEAASLRKAIRPGSTHVDPAVVADDFRVVGIFRGMTDEERKEAWAQFAANSDLVLPRRTAADLAFRDPTRREQGIDQAVLLVDDMRNVKEVVDRVEALGLRSHSIVNFIERERLTYLLIFGGMTCVAGVALLVSSLGIANTMLMSVLERRREIGIMKAVGAADWQLQAVFVLEGGLIGLVGGALGLLLAWSISFPGDAWVRSMVHSDMKIHLSGSIFAFPARIGVTVLLFTVAVTIVAALYPARRAAKVDPVSALRHD